MSNRRIPWVDTARALAISFVFIYHALDPLIYADFPHGLLVGRFLNAFTIPFFFFLSGYVASRPRDTFREHLKASGLSLVVPLVCFNILGLILLIAVRRFYAGPLVLEAADPFATRLAALFIGGLPMFNAPTWFLTCLFTVRLLEYALLRLTNRRTAGILAGIILLAGAGWLMPLLVDRPGAIFKIMKYFWFFPTALSAAVFYLAGVLSRRARLERLQPWAAILCPTAFLALLLSFNANTAAFDGPWRSQFMNVLNYGNYLLFLFTGFAGTVWATTLAMLLPETRLLGHWGRNTLVLLGLNGIFLHFINHPAAHMLLAYTPDMDAILFWPLVILVTLAQLALCRPLFTPVNRGLTLARELTSSVLHRLPAPVFQEKNP